MSNDKKTAVCRMKCSVHVKRHFYPPLPLPLPGFVEKNARKKTNRITPPKPKKPFNMPGATKGGKRALLPTAAATGAGKGKGKGAGKGKGKRAVAHRASAPPVKSGGSVTGSTNAAAGGGAA